MKIYPTKEELNRLFYYESGHLVRKISLGKSSTIGEKIGYLNNKNYVVAQVSDNHYVVHRLIYIFHYGDIPKNLQIDHINGIKWDNRIENLRLATISQNICNTKERINNKSGYKCIFWFKYKQKWGVNIKKDNKNYHVGYFDDIKDAIISYNKKALELYGEFAYINKYKPNNKKVNQCKQNQ